MTKADIVREIATQTGLEKQVVLQVVEGFMDSVKSSMINGEEVYLRQFHPQAPCGKDSTQHKQEYHGDSACPQYPGIQAVKSLCRKDEIRQIR